VPEQRVKAPLIEAQSAAIARAMASIGNAEQGCFGVMSGHARKTLRLSHDDRPDPRFAVTRECQARVRPAGQILCNTTLPIE
jgi:hypothetical protein